MINYAMLGEKTLSLIKEYGFSVYLSKKIVSDDDSIGYDIPIAGYALNVKNMDSFFKGTIIEGTRKLLVVISATPEVGDVIVIDGESLTIVAVELISPGGVTLYYEVYAR